MRLILEILWLVSFQVMALRPIDNDPVHWLIYPSTCLSIVRNKPLFNTVVIQLPVTYVHITGNVHWQNVSTAMTKLFWIAMSWKCFIVVIKYSYWNLELMKNRHCNMLRLSLVIIFHWISIAINNAFIIHKIWYSSSVPTYFYHVFSSLVCHKHG